MMRSRRILLCLGILLVLAFCQEDRICAQDFPYVVPQAPEFDGQGTQVDSQPGYPEAPRRRSKRRVDSFSPNDQTDVRRVRPYVQQEAQVPAAAVRPPNDSMNAPGPGYGSPAARTSVNTQGQGYATPPAQSAPIASVPSQPAPQAQQRLDCSRFPMMIAQAKSEQEMQNAARLYLTCLLHSGWSMEQARQHVITTVETTYRASR